MAQKLFSPDSVTRGLKIVAGSTALDGTNPTVIATGLKTILGVALTIYSDAAPADGTSVLTYAASGGSLSVYAWKNTGGTDPTLVASTGTDTFGYVVFGY